MSSHLSQRVQFEEVVAGVLRMITEFSYFREIGEFINPKLLFPEMDTEEVETLRAILVLMKKLVAEGQIENFSPAFIEGQILIKNTNEEKGFLYKQIYCNWLSDDKIKAIVNDDGCFESFLNYIKALQIFEIGGTFGGHLQKNEIDKAVNMMNAALHRIAKIGNHNRETLRDDEPLDILRKNSELSAYRHALYLGNPLLDHVLDGFEQNTLNLFISTTGGGKSMMAHHLCARSVEQGLYAWVGVLEDRKKSFTFRLLSRLSGVPIRRLTKEYKRLTSQEHEAINEANEKIKKYLRVEFIYGNNLDAIHKAAMDWDLECKLRDKPVAMVNIVDYTGHIAGLSGSSDKMFEKLRMAYGARKDFALKHDKICFDFAQINRQGTKDMGNKHVITHSDLAGGFDIAQVCDNIISLNRGDDDIEKGTSKLHVSKGRDAGKGMTVQVRVEFDKALYRMDRWELTSTGHKEALEIARKISQQQPNSKPGSSEGSDQGDSGKVVEMSKRT